MQLIEKIKSFRIKNAVLHKDMNLDMKRPKILIICLIFNVLLGFIAFLTLAIMQGIGASYGAVSYRALVWLFIGMVWVETGLICFLVPALTAGCISIEKERQTLDVLLTTRMTPWQIIKGKFFSSIMFILLLIISSLPILSLVFIYGGISFFQLLLVVLVLMVTTMYLACFGVFFSTLVKNTVVSVILTYIAVGAVLTFGPSLATMGIGLVEAVNSTLYSEVPGITTEHLLNGDFLILLMIGNPLVSVFDSVGRIFGYTIDGFTVNGMVSLGDVLSHFTEKNILLQGWSIFSSAFQLGFTYLMLRWSAKILNPVKKRKNRYKR